MLVVFTFLLPKKTRNQHGDIKYYPLYIGQTESFRNRLTASHEKWPCAVENNVDCLCVLVEDEHVFSQGVNLIFLVSTTHLAITGLTHNRDIDRSMEGTDGCWDVL